MQAKTFGLNIQTMQRSKLTPYLYTYGTNTKQHVKLPKTKPFLCSSCTLDHFHANIASSKAFMYIRQGYTHGLRNETTCTLMAHSSSIQAHGFKTYIPMQRPRQRSLSANKANFGVNIQDMQRPNLIPN